MLIVVNINDKHYNDVFRRRQLINLRRLPYEKRQRRCRNFRKMDNYQGKTYLSQKWKKSVPLGDSTRKV